MVERLGGSLRGPFVLIWVGGVGRGRRSGHGETETRQLSPPGRNTGLGYGIADATMQLGATREASLSLVRRYLKS